MKFLTVLMHISVCFTVFNLYSNDSCTSIISHDYFYRAYNFKKIENICFQLTNDLDVFMHNSLLSSEQTSYVLQQFCSLFTAVHDLLSNSEESRQFLPDDIVHLLNLVQNLQVRVKTLQSNNDQEYTLIVCMQTLLEQSYQKLEKLIEHNIEVVFDPTMLEQHLIPC